MRGARFFAMLWLAGAAAGCGGQLAVPDAGAGGGPGTGGSGLVDGDTGGSTGGTGGVTELEIYRWAGATVHVTTALGTPDGLKVRRSDEETATVYPPATTPEDDGAVMVAHHTCAAPSLYEVDLWSCGRQYDSNVPPPAA